MKDPPTWLSLKAFEQSDEFRTKSTELKAINYTQVPKEE